MKYTVQYVLYVRRKCFKKTTKNISYQMRSLKVISRMIACTMTTRVGFVVLLLNKNQGLRSVLSYGGFKNKQRNRHCRMSAIINDDAIAPLWYTGLVGGGGGL